MKRNRIVAFIAALALALFAIPSMALASGGGGGNGGGNGGGTGTGNGDGNGTADGKAIPTLVSTLPEEGATVEAADAAEIALMFSNNVTDAEHLEANIAKVHLEKSDGTAVEATVAAVDTQVEPDKRDNLYITPAAELEPGDYVIVAEAGITAKNGNATESDARVTFTIAGAAAAPASTAAPASAAAPASTAATTSAQSSSGMGMTPFVIGGVIVIAAIAGVLYARSRKMK